MFCDGCGGYSDNLESTGAGLICDNCYRIYSRENDYYEKYKYDDYEDT